MSRLDDGDIGYPESDPLLDRLRRALPDYAVERRVAVGGMGVVFRGRDRALDMPVAVKVLRPELATAVGAERFLREARMLAAVSHPGIVTIHKVGETDGLFYFVMEWLYQTLADRLRGGPMQPGDVIRMGRELLDGLARVHDREIIHRDIKPSNIFFVEDGRAKLGDFGIARHDRSVEPPITETGSSHGTPAYMAPEQFVTGDVTPAADQYAIGMVCYEAVTGRRWRSGSEPAEEDWRGVPGRLRPVLERALAPDPADRWPGARALAEALSAVQAPRRGWWAVGAAAAVLVALVALFWPPPRPPGPAASEVAVLPLVGGGPGPDLGGEVAVSTAANLGYAFSDGGVAATPMQLTRPWAAQRTDAAAPLPPDSWDDLHTERILRGRLVPFGDSMAVQAELVHRDGRIQPLARVTGPPHPGLLGHRLAFEVVRVLHPDRTGAYNGLPGGEDNAAVAALVSAEYAFQRDNWDAAEKFYDRAIALDSSLMLAQWGRFNVRRWRRATQAEDVAALERLYERHGDALLGLDRLLIQADLAPTVPERVAIYQSAISLYPYDPYPRSLLGNELFHRGPLAGYGLDTAITVLQEAAAANPYMASTLANLVWGLTRQGDSTAAAAALATHAGLTQAQPDADFCMQCVLELAWTERFVPAGPGPGLDPDMLGPDGLVSLRQTVRLGLAFGLPATQYEIGEQLAGLDDPGARTIGLTAQALALLAQGRVSTAIDRLDAAGQAGGDPEFAFEANQWRVVLPALGVPGVPDADREAGRAALAQVGDGRWAARVHWSLLVDAVARGAPDAATHADALDTLPDSGGLRALARALRLAARGDTAGAVTLADSLRYHVLARDIEDPLQRAVLFLQLGEWLAGTRSRAADAVWRWYENADFLGWPEGHPQAGELDWALETFARYRRARLARASGRTAAACGLLPDAIRRWANAAPSYQQLRDELSAWHRECARS